MNTYDDTCDCPICERDRLAWTPGLGARWRLAIVAALLALALVVVTSPRADAANRTSCQRIEEAFLNVGAPTGIAQYFAYRIAWRESRCRPVYVHDRDDWSYSTVGLNGKTRALRRGWQRLCGHDVRTWAGYEQDAECALAAFRAMGWRPWR